MKATSRAFLGLACAVAVLDSIFIAALAPLLPVYAETLEIGSGAAGVLAASYSLGLLVGALPAGILTLRLGPRTVLVIALGVLASSSVAFGLADSFAVLVAARTLEGVASAFAWTAMLAWLVAVTEPGRRARLLGLVFGAAFAGFTLGPALGAVAVATGPGPAFVALGVLAGAVAAWSCSFAAPILGAVRSSQSYSRLMSQPGVPYSLWLQTLPGVLVGAVSVVAALRLAELGAADAGVAAAFLVASAAQGVVSPLVGRWTDRSGPLRPTRVGLVAGALAGTVLGVVGDAALLTLVLVVAWVAFTTILVPATAMLTSAVENAKEDPSLGFALMNVAFAPGALAGALLAGAIRDTAGDVAALSVVVLTCVATLVIPAPAGSVAIYSRRTKEIARSSSDELR